MGKEGLYTTENIKKVLKSKGIPIDGRLLACNIIGIRKKDKSNVNYFEDTLINMIYKNTGLTSKTYTITTTPGLFYLKNPINSKGTAILKEGYYENCWAYGKHKGHDALVQVGKMTVYRDSDKDEEIDLDVPTEEGLFGINCHGRYFDGKSVDWNKEINRWSAGCTVFENNVELSDFLSDCLIHLRVGHGKFSYILLNEEDFLGL